MRAAVVFHRGALGDSVLTWPLLRSLAQRHDEVAFVTDLSKGRLAQRFADARVLALDAERPEFAALWHGGGMGVTPVDADLVIHLCATPIDDGGRNALDLWERGAKSLYPGARIVMGCGVLDRPRALELANAYGHMREVRPRTKSDGPIVIHVGAGSAEKRWPLPLWRELRRALENPNQDGGAIPRVIVIAGEAEQERFNSAEREFFAAMGGRFIETLQDLGDLFEGAALVIGADSGPTHVAAAMGVPALALFGPTDPERWSPIGPQVRVLAPPAPRGMAWLSPRDVSEEARAILGGAGKDAQSGNRRGEKPARH